MGRRLGLALAACLILAPCPSARSDDTRRPDPHAVLARLRSDDPCEVAWGAWLAAEHRLTAARRCVIPLLERLAARRRESDGAADPLVARLLRPETHIEPWIVEEHALDLAIRLEVMPPRHLLGVFVDGGRASVAALLLTHPDPPAGTLVAAFTLCCADFEPEAWIALGNLMARRRTPGFAARVLQNHTLHRTLRVWDDDDDHPPPCRPRDGICYDGFHRVPDGYPPTVVYRLRLQERHEDGERQVSWHRGVSPDRKLGFGGVTGTWPEPGPVREAWLRRLVGPTDAQPPPCDGHHDVEYVGRQPWARALRAWIEGIHEQHWRFVAALLARGVVRPDEVGSLLPRVEVEIQDNRGVRRRPLPPLPSVPPSVPSGLVRRLREMALLDPRAGQ